MTSLDHFLREHAFLKEQLRIQFPQETEEDLADSLEGISNLPDMLARVIRSALEDEAVCEALDQMIARMTERYKRIEYRAGKKREIVAGVMDRAELTRLSPPDFTVTLSRRAGGVVIANEAEIPAAYMVTPEPPPARPDRKAIKAEIDAGRAVPGAALGNGSTVLQVRTR